MVLTTIIGDLVPTWWLSRLGRISLYMVVIREPLGVNRCFSILLNAFLTHPLTSSFPFHLHPSLIQMWGRWLNHVPSLTLLVARLF